MRRRGWQAVIGAALGFLTVSAAPVAGQEPATVDSLAPVAADSADRPPVLRHYGDVTPPRGREYQRGEVVLRMILDTLGRVERKSIEVLSARDSAFAGAARRVVYQFRFDPAYSHGHRVRVLIVQRIRFEPM